MSGIERLLVANRGEIAVRVVRTAREMGIHSIAVYADQDVHTLACDLADEAYSLRGTAAADTYMNPQALLAAARRSAAQAIHPGYGFLAEDADFAQAVQDAGLIWIGPSATAIRALGDKIQARQIAEQNQVGTIPGISTAITGLEDVLQFTKDHGWPIVLKKSDGGGGRGITRLDSAEDAQSHFENLPEDADFSTTFVEKLILNARHVETQCLRDSHGNFRVITTRDCSVQRRNQKVIEEAPAPHLSDAVLGQLTAWSRALFEAVDYKGAGTCEFLVDEDESAYFLEVNPRLQVEHTVSEEVAGIDLVREQINIANGLALSEPSIPVKSRGHSIELRLTSENPADDLMPATGKITSITWPGGLGVRVDSFLRTGDVIGADFDSLIAKIIVTGPDRATALARARRALVEFSVDGLPTSAPLLQHILTHEDFIGPDVAPDLAAKINRRGRGANAKSTDPSGTHRFRVYTKWMENEAILDAVKRELGPDRVPVTPADEVKTFVIEVAGRRMHLKLPAGLVAGAQAAGAATQSASAAITQAARDLPKQRLRGKRTAAKAEAKPAGADAVSPIQATVVRVAVEPQTQVKEGDLIAVLESMKMEKYIYAQARGTITKIHVGPGQSVTTGQLLVSVEEDE